MSYESEQMLNNVRNEESTQRMAGHDAALTVKHLSKCVRVDDLSRGTYQVWNFPGEVLNDDDCRVIAQYFHRQRASFTVFMPEDK